VDLDNHFVLVVSVASNGQLIRQLLVMDNVLMTTITGKGALLLSVRARTHNKETTPGSCFASLCHITKKPLQAVVLLLSAILASCTHSKNLKFFKWP
jgi:hypothetical protein